MIIIVLPDIQAEDRLLDRARRGERQAQRQIYESYFPPIYQFIRLRVNDRDQARDIAQDVFSAFFVALRGKSPPQKSLRAWLFRVARNKIYDHYGEKKQFPTTTLDEWIPASSDDNPEASFMRSSRTEHTRSALKQLVAEQQEVLILRFGQDLSLEETADLMNKSVSAVKSLQFRAVERLRQLLDVAQ